MLLQERKERDTILHCHITEDNKDWLLKMSEKTERFMGDIVDEIISYIRADTKLEKKK